jgi:hypothetical protein
MTAYDEIAGTFHGYTSTRVNSWDPLDFGEHPNVHGEATPDDFDALWAAANTDLRKYAGQDQLRPNPEDLIPGREIGDDNVSVSVNPSNLAIVLAAQQVVLGMKTSEEDTVISSYLWDLCEVSGHIPSDDQVSWSASRKGGEELGFTDIIPIRLIGPYSKGQTGDYASTAAGKAAYTRSRTSAVAPRLRGYIDVANLLQDGILQTERLPEPKYIPVSFGGLGCREPFGLPENLFLYCQVYKGGNSCGMLGSLVKEAKQALKSWDEGTPFVPALMGLARRKTNYISRVGPFHVAEGEASRLPPPLYEALGDSVFLHSVEERLKRTNFLMGKEAAELALQVKTRNEEILFGDETVIRQGRFFRARGIREREAFSGALRASTAYHEITRGLKEPEEIKALISEKLIQISFDPETRFALEDAYWLVRRSKGEIFELADLTTHEDMYLSSDVDNPGLLRVSGIMLRTQRGFRETRAERGMFRVSPSLYEWAEGIEARFRGVKASTPLPLPRPIVRQILTEDLSHVNDDSGLIDIGFQTFEDEAQPTRNATVGILTADKRLCQRFADTVVCNVVMMSLDTIMDDVDPTSARQEMKEEILRVYDRAKHPKWKKPVAILLDTGYYDYKVHRGEILKGRWASKTVTNRNWQNRSYRLMTAEYEKYGDGAIFSPTRKRERARGAWERLPV